MRSTFSINTKSNINWIDIGTYPNKKQKNTALLHELGHYVDFKKLNRSVSSIRKNTTINQEKKAWKYCLRLSDQYNIPIDLPKAKEWLATYGATYKVLDNRIMNE